MILHSRDRQILHIALPSIVSNITVPLLGLIDVAITGHLGSAAYIGAIAVGGMLFNIIYWMFAFLRMGTSGMTAQARGRRDFDAVLQLLASSLGVAMVASVALMLLTPVVREVALYFIAPSPEVMSYTRTYFNICIFGAPASLGLFALNGWFIGMQNSRIPMFIAISQNILNIIASLIMVYVLGMKVEGIATGTVIAQWGGFLTALFLLHRYYNRLWVNGFPRNIISRRRMVSFFSVNRDIFLRTLCLITVHFLFIAAGARLGDVELAVNTLIMQLFTLYSYFMDGFAFAGEALAGKAYGARNSKAYSETLRHLFAWGMMMTMLFTALYACFGANFLQLLTSEPSVATAAMRYHHWALLFPVCGMLAFIWDGIFIGITATRQMLFSTLFGMLAFAACCVLLFPRYHNHGLWIAYNANLLVRGIVLTVAHQFRPVEFKRN